MVKLTVSPMNRTLPSAIAAVTPPAWALRAGKIPLPPMSQALELADVLVG